MEVNENNSQEKEKKKGYDKITVYLPPGLKKIIDDYVVKNHYSNRSVLFRRAFKTLSYIFPLETSGQEKPKISIQEQLEAIEKKIDALKIEKQIIEKEEEVIEKEEELIDNEFDEFPLEGIPQYNSIADNIFYILEEFPEHKIKDFVLMQYLRQKFSDGSIWAVLVQLKNKKLIKLKDGYWQKFD